MAEVPATFGPASREAGRTDAWDDAPVGLATLDVAGTILRINRAGLAILEVPSGSTRSVAGVDVPSIPPDTVPFPPEETEGDAERTVEWSPPGGRARILAYRVRQGREELCVAFRDVTKQRRQQRRIAAVASTAASVASERSLAVSLGAIAREVARADGLAGVQILAADRRQDEGLRVMGSAGFQHSNEFFDLLMKCRERGASLKMLEAYETGEAVVVPERYAAVMSDPAWAPMHDYLRTPVWDSFVSVPLLAHHRPIGILNAFFNPGQQVDDDALAFLSTMADQAALAVDYAELLERQRQDAGRAERQRLARELHDSVVQQVFSIGMQTEALKLLSTRGDQPSWARVGPVAQELEAMSRSVLSDLRSLVAQLHPAPPTTNGLCQALTDLISTTRRRTEVAVTLTCPTTVDELSDALSEDVYFVIAEALHNAVKHADAATIDVELIHDQDRGLLTARVSDDGCGLAARSEDATRPDGGYGLISMRERAELWRGTLDIEAVLPKGTRVVMQVPTSAIHPSVIGARR